MGNGRRKRPRFPGLESPAIAHNEVAASAKVAAVEAPGRSFFGNRGSTAGKFTPSRKRNFRASPTSERGAVLSRTQIIRL
jgi:hypothetical protein